MGGMGTIVLAYTYIFDLINSAKIFELTNLIDRDWMRASIAGLEIPNCVSIVNY